MQSLPPSDWSRGRPADRALLSRNARNFIGGQLPPPAAKILGRHSRTGTSVSAHAARPAGLGPRFGQCHPSATACQRLQQTTPGVYMNTQESVSTAAAVSGKDQNASRDEFAAMLNETLPKDEAYEGSVVKGRIIAIEKDLALIDVGLKM